MYHTDFLSYEVNAALLALDFLDRLPRGVAAGLRKISAHTGVAGIRMHSIMKTLHQMRCVEFSIEHRAGYSIHRPALDKSLRELVYALNRDIRINGKNHKDPQVNIEWLCQSACEVLEQVRTHILAALDIPLKDLLATSRITPVRMEEQQSVLRLATEAQPQSYAAASSY